MGFSRRIMAGLKLHIAVGVIAQLGERTTEDRKVPCSIHGNPTAYAVPGSFFPLPHYSCQVAFQFYRAGKRRFKLCSQAHGSATLQALSVGP